MTAEPKVLIYALKEPDTGEVRYVGLTRDLKARLARYRHKAHNKHLQNWIAKLLQQGKFPSVETLAKVTEGDAGHAEREWIRRYRLADARLLNFTDGGESQYSMAAEVRRKIRQHRLDWWREHRDTYLMPKTQREAISRGNKGKRHGRPEQFRTLNVQRAGIPLTEDHRRKISESLRGKPQNHSQEELKQGAARLRAMWANPETRERMREGSRRGAATTLAKIRQNGSPLKGRKLSEDHRRKVSEGVRRSQTMEYRQKMSRAKKDKVSHPMTEEMKRKISVSLRAYFAAKKEGGARSTVAESR